ncbi:MAG: hypothetical protein ACOCZK_07515 [Planctomycetota bacterium]
MTTLRILPCLLLLAMAWPLICVERLWLDDARIAELRDLIRSDHPDIGMAHELLRRRVDGDLAVYGDSLAYMHGYRAREAALLAQLSEDDDLRQHYARLAIADLRAIYDPTIQGDRQRLPDRGYGLGRGMQSLSLALTWSWCHRFWSVEDREWVRDAIDRSLDAWEDYHQINLGHPHASNWVAVCHGGELILLLAAGEQTDRAERYEFLVRRLIEHIGVGFGDQGGCQEGIAYTEYPGAFLLPAILASRQLGDERLWRAAQQRSWWRLAMYAESFHGSQRKFVQFGVDHSGNYNEGWVSLLAAFVPTTDVGAYRWFYDRHMGRLSRMGPIAFDGQRAGTIWALLYYPDSTPAEDPTARYPTSIVDDHGYVLFRNRWRDADDVQATIAADLIHRTRSWDQAEGLALNLLAFDHRIIGGPGKKRDPEHYSGLLVDGRWTFPAKRTPSTSGPLAVERNADGVAASVQGGPRYRALGFDRVERQWLVHAPADAEVAVLATYDDGIAASARHFRWQANTKYEDWDWQADREAGCPTMVLRGRDGVWLKAWILSPADWQWSTPPAPLAAAGKPAKQLRSWVALACGRGEPSIAHRDDTGLDSRFSVAGRSLQLIDGRLTLTADGVSLQVPHPPEPLLDD